MLFYLTMRRALQGLNFLPKVWIRLKLGSLIYLSYIFCYTVPLCLREFLS
jgi:hypothetical protein